MRRLSSPNNVYLSLYQCRCKNEVAVSPGPAPWRTGASDLTGADLTVRNTTLWSLCSNSRCPDEAPSHSAANCSNQNLPPTRHSRTRPPAPGRVCPAASTTRGRRSSGTSTEETIIQGSGSVCAANRFLLGRSNLPIVFMRSVRPLTIQYRYDFVKSRI